MLRWCQSTARALNRRGITSVLTRELHAESSKSITQKAISLIYCTYVTRNINGYLNDKQSSSIPELDSIIIEPASPKGSRNSLTAFITLSDFLSCKDPRSYPKKYSLDTLKLLYNTVKAQGQLELLSSKHLTELISLFGTLSLPDPRNGLIYISKLAPHVTSRGDDTEKWDFLIEVARDKQKTLKMKLNGTDGFWLMRALLTKVVLAEGETSLSPGADFCFKSQCKFTPHLGDPREQALSEATQHYLRIWKHAYDIEIHLPLLQKWFDLGSQKETAALVNRLCRVLELHIYPNSRLTEVLWRLILRKTLPLGAALKSRILSMINTRLSPQFDETRQAFGAKKKKNNPSYSPPSQLPEGSNNFSTVELGNALGTALFPAPGAAGTQIASKEVRDWATEQARQAFAPAVTQDVQWSNLLLLAIHQSDRLNIPLSPNPQAPQSQVEEDTTRSPESRSESHSEPESEPNGDWRPVLLLNALERTTNGGTITESSTRESVQGVVRPLWVTWKAGGEDTSRSLDVNTSRPIAAAFFRLAAKIVDGPLAEACYRFCVKHDLFRNTEILAEGAVHSWADLNAAYVLAVATCRGVGWQVAFEETEISGSRDLVLSLSVCRYEVVQVERVAGVSDGNEVGGTAEDLETCGAAFGEV
ncbi:hypothetical protein H0H93_012623 [Arthromyces matolae]|nr:hypothetical protein H0H93_012623 [Arthromyces matolae]